MQPRARTVHVVAYNYEPLVASMIFIQIASEQMSDGEEVAKLCCQSSIVSQLSLAKCLCRGGWVHCTQVPQPSPTLISLLCLPVILDTTFTHTAPGQFS